MTTSAIAKKTLIIHAPFFIPVLHRTAPDWHLFCSRKTTPSCRPFCSRKTTTSGRAGMVERNNVKRDLPAARSDQPHRHNFRTNPYSTAGRSHDASLCSTIHALQHHCPGTDDRRSNYSITTKGCPFLTAAPCSTRNLTTLQSSGTLIWLKSFMASTIQTASPFLTLAPSSAKFGLPGPEER